MTDERPIALVTGAAVRVGAAIATALADAGHRVWIHHHRSGEAALALAQRLRARNDAVAGVVAADLSDANARAELVATVLAGGRLDVLVNSAASFERGDLLARTDADLERVLRLNLVAPIALVRACARTLGAAPHGCVVNIVDAFGRAPVPGYLDHCVAKAGLELATRALAIELAPLRVNAVAPGTVDWPTDPRYADAKVRAGVLAQIPLGRIGTPEDVAGAVTYLVGARHVTGHTLVVDGGRTAGSRG